MNSFLKLAMPLVLAAASYVEATALPSQTSAYFDLYQQYPKALGPNGSYRNGEIEIVLDPQKITQIQQECYQRLLKKGISKDHALNWSTIGVVAEDQYWIWLRDAVIFPSNVVGTYDRLLWKSSLDGPAGVAVFAILPNKKIALNLNFRHATRSWEIELPRGGRNKKESIEDAAKRELKEETGYVVENPLFLGNIATDTGALSSIVPVYCGLVTDLKSQDAEFSEAIEDILALSKEEIKEGFVKGYIEVSTKGKMIKAPCRDAFLAYALLLAESRGLL